MSGSTRGGAAGRSTAIDAWRAIDALAVVAFHAREIGWIGIRRYAEQVPPSLAPDALHAYGSAPLVFGVVLDLAGGILPYVLNQLLG